MLAIFNKKDVKKQDARSLGCSCVERGTDGSWRHNGPLHEIEIRHNPKQHFVTCDNHLACYTKSVFQEIEGKRRTDLLSRSLM